MNKRAIFALLARVDEQKTPKLRVRGVHYFGEHKARTGRGRWAKFYCMQAKWGRGCVFKLVEQSSKRARPLKARKRGKGLRALHRKLRSWSALALCGAGLFWML